VFVEGALTVCLTDGKVMELSPARLVLTDIEDLREISCRELPRRGGGGGVVGAMVASVFDVLLSEGLEKITRPNPSFSSGFTFSDLI
jgi:hypothetical protein